MANYHRHDAAGPQRTSDGTTVTFRSLHADLDALRASAPAGIVDSGVTTVGRSEQGRELWAIRIGRNPAVPVLIAGCHHAREWISVEIPYLFAEFLVRSYDTDPTVRRLVDSRDIWVVPMINPDGHEHTVLHNRMWRKNFPTAAGRQKVDLNRNYDTAFWNTPRGQFSDDPSSQLFRGRSSGYAREVRAMQDLIRTQRFRATLDFHSFGRFVLFPWSGRTAAPPDAAQDAMATRLEAALDGRIAGVDYQRAQASSLYAILNGAAPADAVVPGGMMDYVVERVAGSIAITVELEPASNDPRGFNLPDTEIQPTFDLLKRAMLTFLNCMESIRTPPATRSLPLAPDVDNPVVVLRTECAAAFAGY
ncbi:MAG: hypothetical protein JO040_05130 [Gemmatimonadetes bacterium]|nr:hypothetical protein [Gemmatimonadota bacterium]